MGCGCSYLFLRAKNYFRIAEKYVHEEVPVNLSPREIDKLYVYVVADRPGNAATVASS